MFTPILVAYASRYGSTREVAEVVSGTLRQDGREVDLAEMQGVRSLEGYRAVVIGAPFCQGRWHADVRPFLTRFQGELREHPVAIFALGPVGAAEVGDSREALLEELTGYPWLHPISAEMFAGVYDLDRLSRADGASMRSEGLLHGRVASDRRDWDAIRSWARGVGEILLPAPT